MKSTDFSKGKVWQNIVAQSIPLILAQVVQLLYNVVDRIYIGHLPGADSMALTGIGLVFPLTTLIAAFTFLFGTGGTPLFSIARGARQEERAGRILGNTFSLLLGAAVLLLLSAASANPLPVRRQRRLVLVRGCLSENLSVWNCFYHAVHRPEWFHQRAGIPADRYVDDAAWSYLESGVRSCFYLRITYGSCGRCTGNGDQPGGFLCVGVTVFDRKESAASDQERESADR